MTIFQRPVAPMLSPCIGVCRLGSDGLCEGCYRNAEEIARWTLYSDMQRRELLDEVLPGRAGQNVR